MPYSHRHTFSYRKACIGRYTCNTGHGMSPSSTVGELLSYIDQENHSNKWAKQFHDAQLYKCGNLPAQSAKPFRGDAELFKYIEEVLVTTTNHNVASVLSVSQREDRASMIDIVYLTPKFTLHDVLTYSPAVFYNSFCKVQFVIYQLLQCQHYLHSKGTLLGTITLKDVYIDEFLWVSVCPKLCEEFSPPPADMASDSEQLTISTPPGSSADEETNLPAMTNRWVNGALSNFDYLMYINKCCGRVLGHPNHHPVFPWIMDFTQPLGGWRDLTKSKFRLNKGDDQLDQTYEVAQRILSEGVDDEDRYDDPQTVFPHHISDVLSDITYYTYKARRTPKETLCQFVRQKWVPHEYPSSIKRLQEWTPDECIPEFYTDPSIFQSIHDDLDDLEIPSWAQSPENFIEQHRAALESNPVSQHLHHWIDLTFGVKLTGKAAIEAKNVCLELIDGHKTYTDHGIVQLFTKPHPERVCISTKYISARAPDILCKRNMTFQQQVSVGQTADSQESPTEGTEFEEMLKSMESLSTQQILLPPDFDPLELLDRIEKDPHTSPASKKCRCNECPYHRDTLYLGCLLAKIILPLHTRVLPDPESMQLEDYVNKVQETVVKHKHRIPRALYSILETALEIKEESADITHCKYTENLPPVTASLLLAPSVLPLPTYFDKLYDLVSAHIHKGTIIDDPNTTSQTRESVLKERLSLHTSFVGKYGVTLQEEGLELYLPYIKHLLTDSAGDRCVQAVWGLFSPLSQILGKEGTYQHLSKHIQDLYSREDISSSRKVKLYHRTFLQQLVTQLGVTHFIQDYSSPLVTALCTAAAYNDDISIPRDHGRNLSTQVSSDNHGVDLAAILTESIVWLAARLGPLLTARYFTSKILQTMKDCYCVESAYEEDPESKDELMSIIVEGDVFLLPAIKCLEEISFLYGEQFILLQYIPSIARVVNSCDNGPLQPKSAASLLSICTLLLHLIPCLTEGTLLDLIETRLINEILLPLVVIVSDPNQLFPSYTSSTDGAASRRLLAFRVLDLVILISQRIGYDQTRRFLRRTLQAFFKSFDIVHSETGSWSRIYEVKHQLSSNDSSGYIDIKQSVTDANEFYVGTPVHLNSRSSPERRSMSPTELSRSEISQDVLNQLQQVFTAELAHKAFIQCCRLVGGLYITELANDDLIRRLCTQYEEQLKEKLKRVEQTEVNSIHSPSSSYDEEAILGDRTKTTNWFVPVPLPTVSAAELSSSPYEGVSGNKLTYIPPANERKKSEAVSFSPDNESKYQAISAERLKRPEMEAQTTRHLKGDWVAYWEHELGHNPGRSRNLDFKQIGLQVFTGHTGIVKSLHVLDNENSLVSASKDRTVKLWSLRNTGNGTSRCNAQFTYSEHKRPVFFATFLDSVKHMVSCDGSIHVWDAITGAQISQYDSSKPTIGYTTVQTVQNSLFDHLVVAATPEYTLRFLDVRAERLAHEFRINSIPSSQGSISGIALGPTWIAVAHAIGSICILDFRTGFRLASWQCKGIEGDLTQVVGYGLTEFITYSADGQLSLWKHNQSSPLCQARLSSEQQVNTIRLFDKTIVTASPTNRVSTYQPNIYEGRFVGSVGDKLRPDIFKGNISSMAVLPLNRQLLLGSDSGAIHLIA